jgi:3-methyladenine DNA glycosylase/8-oxoguanine DNA glycosylase
MASKSEGSSFRRLAIGCGGRHLPAMAITVQPARAPRRVRGLGYDPDQACAHLAAADPVLGEIIQRTGTCVLRPPWGHSLFDALLRSIVYQQLSGKAADTILSRVVGLYAPAPTPDPAALLATADAVLRSAGLSGNKTAAIKDLARRALAGTIPTLAQARELRDDELVERLTVVRGVGRWTVEMLLIFRLGRPDVLPVDDLGVRKGFQRAYGMRRLPAAVTITRRAERWRPYRSVASWYLWREAERR